MPFSENHLDHIVIPVEVARCPCCDSAVQLEFDEWEADSGHEIPELMADFAAEQIAELEERLNTAMGLLSEIQFDHSDRNSEDYNECDGNPCEFCKQVRSLADKEYQ